MDYKGVEKQFHILSKTDFDNWFQKRFESDSTFHFDFHIGSNPAFFHFDLKLLKKIIDLVIKQAKLNSSFNELPDIAKKQYIRNSLVIEVKKTNEIEGVFSSKKEIFELAEDLSKSKSSKIGSIVQKYMMLLQPDTPNIKTIEDIHATFDDLFLLNNESLIDPDKLPDGKLFRKGYVGVFKDGYQQAVHHGILPEEEIIRYLQKGLEIYQNKDLHPFIKLSLFHYVFEYVHPFYDGNGRLGRYLLSLYIKNEISELLAFRISDGINHFKSKYYKAFENTEHLLNKGDLTLFVYEFLDIIEKTYDESIAYALKKKEELKKFYEDILSFFGKPSLNEEKVLQILTQSTLFSDFGLPVKDIVQYSSLSERTVRRILDKIKEKGLLMEQHYSYFVYYLLHDPLKIFQRK